jgi:hypothetical protein
MKNGSSPLSGAVRTILVALAVPLALVGARVAHAAETQRDTESDHIDAFDDAGPRTFAALASAGADGLQAIGPRLGVELDWGLGDAAALSLRGDWLALAAAQGAGGYGASVGVPLVPGRVPFHGLYVHPRGTWQRVGADGASTDVVGAALTVGWAWTARWGGTLRLGLGAAYESALPGNGATAPVPFAFGLQPVADAAAGWAF